MVTKLNVLPQANRSWENLLTQKQLDRGNIPVCTATHSDVIKRWNDHQSSDIKLAKREVNYMKSPAPGIACCVCCRFFRGDYLLRYPEDIEATRMTRTEEALEDPLKVPAMPRTDAYVGACTLVEGSVAPEGICAMYNPVDGDYV